MPAAKGWDLPCPEHEQEFEVLCLDLLEARERPIVRHNLTGRRGQAQHGVDFVLQLDNGLHGYQCKRVNSFSEKELIKELTRLKKLETIEGIKVVSYTVLTTVKNDAHLEFSTLRLSQERQQQGLCPIAVITWSTIRDWLAEYPEILNSHYQIRPDARTLLLAAARRLNRELPGASLSINAGPGNLDVVVHPGPDGIPLPMKLKGEEAYRRFESALATAEPVTFSGDEAEIRMPRCLDGLRGSMSMSELRLIPKRERRLFDGRLVIHPSKKHHNESMFRRRAKRSAEYVSVVASVNVDDPNSEVFEVRGRDIPLCLEFRQCPTTKTFQRMDFHRSYEGCSPSAALAAEDLLVRILSESWTAVFCDHFEVICQLGSGEALASDKTYQMVLEMLVEIEELSGWKFVLPHAIRAEEVQAIREVWGYWSGVCVPYSQAEPIVHKVDDDGQFHIFRSALLEKKEDLSIDITLVGEPCEVELLGQRYQLPAVEVRLVGLAPTKDCLAALKGSPGLPFTLELVGTPDAFYRASVVSALPHQGDSKS